MDEGLSWPEIERILQEEWVLEIASEEVPGFVGRVGEQPDGFDKLMEKTWRIYHLTARQEKDEDFSSGDEEKDLLKDEDQDLVMTK